MVTIKVA